MTLKVVPVTNRRLLEMFLHVPSYLMDRDAHWVPPLHKERRDLLNPKKNPYFEHAKVQLFVAIRDEWPVGRISAQIDQLFLERHGRDIGHFGFFDCIDDPDVARALGAAAESWLSGRGMNRVRGPFSLSINEETGVLVDGFDSDPFPFMAHNPPYYDALLQGIGFCRAKDLFAWSYDSTRPVPDPARQIADYVAAYPGLTVREINPRRMEEEMHKVSEVFNSAWQDNWGFVPWTHAEIRKVARDLKMILNPKLALIAEVNGQPAAISIAIPNFHEVIKDLRGSLLPLGWLKLLYRLKTNRIKSGRLALLGIKREFRNDVLKGLSVLLYVMMHSRSQELQHWGGEVSWTLEDNEKINHGIRLMGGVAYKRYRVYEKACV